MELRAYTSVIGRWLWLIVICAVIGAGAAYAASEAATKEYAAVTTLIVGQGIQNPNINSQDIYTSQQLAQTYAQMVTRRPVLQATVDALHLPYTWGQLRSRVNAAAVPGVQLIEIRAVDSDPVRTRDIADELARQLIVHSPTIPEGAEEQQREFVGQQVGDLQTKIQDAQSEVSALDERMREATSAREIQDLQVQITVLQNQINGWQTNYNQFLTFLNRQSTNYLAVMEPAETPWAPIRPVTRNNVVMAGAVALALALGAAFLLEYMDSTIKSPEEAQRLLQLTPLGTLSRRGRVRRGQLVAADKPYSTRAGEYRALQTNILFSLPARSSRTVLLLSPEPTDTKSVLAANLAVAMAQSGLRTTLMDMDLWRPAQHTLFQASAAKGLSDMVMQPQPQLNGHLQTVKGVDRLQLLTTGPLPRNPADLLCSPRIDAVMDSLTAESDVLVIDGPSVLTGTESSLLNERVDGVVLVVEAGRTPRDSARLAAERLNRAGAKVLGVVVAGCRGA